MAKCQNTPNIKTNKAGRMLNSFVVGISCVLLSPTQLFSNTAVAQITQQERRQYATENPL